MWPAAHGHEVDLAPELGIDEGPHHHARMVGAARRHEAKPEPARDHGENPVIALAAVDELAAQEVVLAPDRPGVAVEFAVRTIQVTLAAEVLGHNPIALGERMIRVKDDHH